MCLALWFVFLVDEVGVVEIVDSHGMAHTVEGVGGGGARFLAALAQHFVYGRDILLVLLTAFADGGKSLFKHIEQQLFDSAVAYTGCSGL